MSNDDIVRSALLYVLEEEGWTKIEKKIMPVPESGCHLWIGAITDSGYGVITRKGKRFRVHRLVYERERGAVLNGLQLDHLCRVRCCVNPEHLEVVTSRENTYRGMSPLAQHANKTNCPKGHPYSEGNLVFMLNERKPCRRCRICRLEAQKRYNSAHKDILREKRRLRRLSKSVS